MPDSLAPITPPPLRDAFGRTVTYLRLSVTDRCDLRCAYCMAEHMTFLPKKDLLTLEELETVATAFIRRGVRKIRITGGEPLVRKDIGQLFDRLGTHLGAGLDELTLTTNATLLERDAERLHAAGVRRVNISLDTLDPDMFREITRRGDFDKVIRGINAAQEAGLKIKINTVALRHQNAAEIPHMVEWAHGRGFDMTLIEVMPLGDTGEDRIDQYVPLFEIRDRLDQLWTLEDEATDTRMAGPSRYVRIRETGGKLGFITPLTNNFCAGCNRVRVTCTGRIYMCLGQDDHVDLRSALRKSDSPEQALDAALDRALLRKPEKHDFAIRDRAETPALPRHMSVTGG
ncbi:MULTISPECIES: GTP 3',8-cyclase MoaA [Henriciella]|jgi:GTP 3',8-cyclase|uniref:GTP 3',8-cyclase n=1 Tax=Henriciella pelagia TaxID=1977912 RepID=A0ABQ1JGW9_9PROT|nr:GTP 3',8-cyclase MoaA [Henriciella pelagia]GGB68249.1 cyclic pyranopterin monophosphate synthase [Henriciella pelagia]